MKNEFLKARLRAARKEAGLTQDATAAAIGVPRTNYYPYEMGRRVPAGKFWIPLAAALKISLVRLKAWIAINEFGEEVILAACKELKRKEEK